MMLAFEHRIRARGILGSFRLDALLTSGRSGGSGSTGSHPEAGDDFFPLSDSGSGAIDFVEALSGARDDQGLALFKPIGRSGHVNGSVLCGG